MYRFGDSVHALIQEPKLGDSIDPFRECFPVLELAWRIFSLLPCVQGHVIFVRRSRVAAPIGHLKSSKVVPSHSRVEESLHIVIHWRIIFGIVGFAGTAQLVIAFNDSDGLALVFETKRGVGP